MPNHQIRYTRLSNEAVREYGFTDFGDFVRSSFEIENLTDEFDLIYAKLEKLYRMLHAYVKKRLGRMYPGRVDTRVGALPAHVLGDAWAQQWHNIYEDVKPFANKSLLDVTPKMLAQVSMTKHICSYYWIRGPNFTIVFILPKVVNLH